MRKQKGNLLKEILFEMELRADEIAMAGSTAFVAHENDKKWSNSTTVNSS
jgi:hypothetical protein